MKRLIPILLLMLGLLSCEPSRHTMTLMTYNVGAFSKYMDNSTEGVAQLILDNGAAFVALNELDSCNRRHGTYQLADLAARLGDWSYQFASAFPYAGGGYGNGVVTSKRVEKGYGILLPKDDGSEQRSVAVVETPDCVFASVHLDHKGHRAALEQMMVVNEWFTTKYAGYSKPVFLCGDFNVTPDSDVIELAERCWIQLSGVDYTHSTTRPRHCIDYVFALKVAAPVQVLESVVLTEGTADLSDHFPVKVTVEY
jgi:endonuclease/exonuclease/phosphatase family metal-dependent hydrolase